MATFKELQDDALDALGYTPGTTPTAVRDRFKRHINLWYRNLLTRPGASRLLRTQNNVTLASVANQALYALPYPAGKLRGIHDRTNGIRLVQRDLDFVRLEDPQLTVRGTPEAYIVHGYSMVEVQPSDASALFVISTSASDTQTAYLEYVTSSGRRRQASVALNGTTAAQISLSGANGVYVSKFYLASAPVGTVTLREDSGIGTTLATVAASTGVTGDIAQNVSSRSLIVQLWPTPSAVVTYYVDLTQELSDLVQDTEVPVIPADFHRLLSLGAQAYEWRRKDDTRAKDCEADIEYGLVQFSRWIWDQTVDDTTDVPRHSRLGSWYPAGT